MSEQQVEQLQEQETMQQPKNDFNKENLPAEITLEYIRQLRFENRHEDAARLLKAFHEDLRKDKEDVLQSIIEQDRRIISHMCRRQNKCTHCKVNTPLEGRLQCAECIEKKRIYNNKAKEKHMVDKIQTESVVIK
jgi:hypothetical protein